jgi:hypothetical protein
MYRRFATSCEPRLDVSLRASVAAAAMVERKAARLHCKTERNIDLIGKNPARDYASLTQITASCR